VYKGQKIFAVKLQYLNVFIGSTNSCRPGTTLEDVNFTTILARIVEIDRVGFSILTALQDLNTAVRQNEEMFSRIALLDNLVTPFEL
jgi:hypothetical protein